MRGRYDSLAGWARTIGVQARTLKQWLRQDAGIELPAVLNGSKHLIAEEDVMKVVTLRRDVRNIPTDPSKRKQNAA